MIATVKVAKSLIFFILITHMLLVDREEDLLNQKDIWNRKLCILWDKIILDLCRDLEEVRSSLSKVTKKVIPVINFKIQETNSEKIQ